MKFKQLNSTIRQRLSFSFYVGENWGSGRWGSVHAMQLSWPVPRRWESHPCKLCFQRTAPYYTGMCAASRAEEQSMNWRPSLRYMEGKHVLRGKVVPVGKDPGYQARDWWPDLLDQGLKFSLIGVFPCSKSQCTLHYVNCLFSTCLSSLTYSAFHEAHTKKQIFYRDKT